MTRFRFLTVILLFIATLCLTACGGLAGEQPIVATLTPAPTEVSAPQSAPDLANGQQIYAKHCTSCHGDNGTGQGELVLSGQVPVMASFLDWEYVSRARPQEYFDIITKGKIEKLMPPWKEALTPAERWDVAMYVYTLRYNADQIARGAEIYAAECAKCHGEDGRGDGPEMIQDKRQASSLVNVAGLASVSDSAYLTTIREGVGDEMPAYQDKLSEADIHAAAAYSRLFTVDAGGIGTQEAPPTSLTIRGTVTNRTANSFIPADTTVFLRYGSMEAGLQTRETALSSDGTYTFNDVPYAADSGYVTFVSYLGNNFTSTVLTADNVSDDSHLPITVYDPTADPRLITVAQIDMNIETQTVENVGTGLVVGQTLTYRNGSDRVFSLPAQDGEVGVSLLIQLPPGAVLLVVDDPSRYIVAEEQGAIIDTLPVLPGDHTVELTYYLPYSNGAIVDQAFTNAINGPITVRLAPTHLRLLDPRFTLQPPAEGEAFHTYTAQIETPYNGALRYEINGALTPPLTNENPRLVTENTLVPLLIGLLIVILIGVGVFAWSRRQPNTRTQIDSLVRRIAELDLMHQQGQINHDVYQRQRQDLKAQLALLMRSETNDTPAS